MVPYNGTAEDGFHLNSHTVGSREQTHKLELHLLHVYIIDSKSERINDSSSEKKQN